MLLSRHKTQIKGINKVSSFVDMMFDIGNTPPRSSPLPFAGPGSLPTILGSPTKMPGGFEFPLITDNNPPEPVHAPFGCYRPRTIPDNMATVAYTSHESTCEHSRHSTAKFIVTILHNAIAKVEVYVINGGNIYRLKVNPSLNLVQIHILNSGP